MPGRHRVAIIGVGRIAQAHIDAYRAHPAAEIVGVADIDAKSLREVAASCACPAFESYEALLAEVRPDAVSVCTPPNSHCEIVLGCLRGGAHVLCEKPFALDLADARRMLDAAAASGRTLMMSAKFRYVAGVIELRRLLSAGSLGWPLHMRNVFSSILDMSQSWHGDPQISGGGVLIDNGIHSLDIARYLLGPLDAVFCYHSPNAQPIAVEDTTHISFRSASGCTGAIDLSWSLPLGNESYLELFAAEQTVRLKWREDVLEPRGAETRRIGDGYDKHKAFAAMIENFLAVTRGAAKALIGNEDIIASVAAMEAAYTSAANGGWVRLQA